MLPRILEPEVMDTREEARDYDAMDHAEVNRLFVADVLKALHSALSNDQSPPAASGGIPEPHVLDLGTGTAQIPIELCRQWNGCRVTAVDRAAEMLKLARRNVTAAGSSRRIELQQADAKRLPYSDAGWDAVISNSIVHHIPEPRTVFREMLRVLRPGGLLFVRDLLRPDDPETLNRLVEQHAGEANDHQRQMFRDSLQAALTVEEVREILQECRCPPEWVAQTSDRHWTVCGRGTR